MQPIREYFWRLQRSYAAVYACLEKPHIARRAVVLLLVIHSGLLAYSAYVHSPTLNEPGHLVAGLSNWKFGRFDIYSVNPPLVRMVAALPVMAAGYEEDWSGFYTGLGARPEFSMGEDFVAANGERSFFLFMIARWACIPFSWIGGIVCYLWARDLYGRPAGVVACGIWSFEPNIVAHASLMTPDAHATALGLAACYTFWRWLKKPTWSQAALTGVVLGLAELAKTTLILFYPLWPLMWLIYRWPERREMAVSEWGRQAGMLALRMAIGLYILNLGYGFEGSLKPLGEFQFVSDLFAGAAAEGDANDPPPLRGGARGGISPASSSEHQASSRNRFAGLWLAALPVPFPKHYLIGIDLQQRDFEDYSRPSYLRGKWRGHGWWYYYLYAVAIKLPLGLLAIGVFTPILRLLPLVALPSGDRLEEGRERTGNGSNRTRSPATTERWAVFDIERLRVRLSAESQASLRDEFVLLLPPIAIFAVVSAETEFSQHMRYVLPCMPFFLIWSSGNCLTFLKATYNMAQPCKRTISVNLFSASFVAICWLVLSSLSLYPHSLIYFNELVGGPRYGDQHLLGSNFDWGQDINRVGQYISEVDRDCTEVYCACEALFDVGDIIKSPGVRFLRTREEVCELVAATTEATKRGAVGGNRRRLLVISRSVLRDTRNRCRDSSSGNWMKGHHADVGYSTIVIQLCNSDPPRLEQFRERTRHQISSNVECHALCNVLASGSFLMVADARLRRE